jgi:dienelactone hydrolase
MLWRSRRRGGSRLRRVARRTVIGGVSVVVAFTTVAPVMFAIGLVQTPRFPVHAAHLGRPYATVSLRSSDGLRLRGWYVPSRNGAAVIAFPGRDDPLPHARMLVRHGYGVLLLDARGYDGSDGAPNMFGWGETRDLDAAVAWLRTQPDVRNGAIGGIGFSVGGEMMLEAAAGNPRLRAVVSEGAGIRSVREEVLQGAASIPALPTQAVQTAALAVLSGASPPPSLRDLVRRIAPRPVFLIYAEHGVGSEDLNKSFYRAAGEPKQLWCVQGAGHTGGYRSDPRSYERRVVGFFDRALSNHSERK